MLSIACRETQSSTASAIASARRNSDVRGYVSTAQTRRSATLQSVKSAQERCHADTAQTVLRTRRRQLSKGREGGERLAGCERRQHLPSEQSNGNLRHR